MSADITPWLAEAARIRDEAGGYTFESLAVAMILKLGWFQAAGIAGALEPHVRGWGWGLQSEQGRAVAPLFEILGWEQSALLLAWFNNLENYREVRDTFPAEVVSR
ncbi:hypothetical protein [Streptomyces sp. NPDC018833]|uniref:hypothetical protein n=1 Tax=Streptomyces sp. NPDC018833 TaxID=3365053 RepID=UPI00379EDD33